jgi:outer membrane receptor protein involved in Fe transport
MLDSEHWILALDLCCRRCALVIAAVLWVAPAWAEDPGDTGEGIASLAEFTEFTDFAPNLEIDTSFAASNPIIFIRGIGLKGYNSTAPGPVAVYQDGVNINSPALQLGQLFDLEGIDVLRGPQGSLNAHNATAGALMIRSAMPDGEFGISTNLTYGNYDNKKVEAAINIPLIEDVLSMRVSGTAQWRDGYTKNQCAGWNPEALGFRNADEAATQELYAELLPAGTIDQATGELRPVRTQRQNGGGRQSNFVYLNYQLAQGTAEIEGARHYTAGITASTLNNPFVLSETVYTDANGTIAKAIDINGNLVDAVAGTAIAKQSNQFFIDDVDGICVTHPHGRLATTQGHYINRTAPDADQWVEGYWGPSRTQPSLQEFAALKPFTNNIDKWAARVILLFEPLDNMEWTLNVHGAQNRGDSAHLQMLGANAKFGKSGFTEKRESDFSENKAVNIALAAGIGDLGEGTRHVDGIDPGFGPGEGGGNPYSGFYSSDGIEFIDTWGVNGRGFWDLGGAQITLLYDYEWYDRVVENEGDANPSRLFPSISSDRVWQTTEELRIEREGERYKWATGFFFLHEKLAASNRLLESPQFELTQNFTQTLTSWAPYVSGEIDLVEEGVIPGIYELTLGAGVRYNREKKEFSLRGSAIGAWSLFQIKFPEEAVEATWKKWTGDVQLTYTPFSNEYGTLLSYLKYGHGYKGGGFNEGLTTVGGNFIPDIEAVEPEFVDSVEFGIRSRWFDDRVVLNAAIFRYWYQDLQIFDTDNQMDVFPNQKLSNGDADVLGAEAELHVRPLPGLLISTHGGWLNSEYRDLVVTKHFPLPRGNPTTVDFDYAGNRLVGAPEWNWTVVTEYEIPLFGWGSLTPRWDFNYRSKAYLDPQMVDPISQDGYWVHNARITYRTPDGRMELALWARNLRGEAYKIDAFDLTHEHDSILEVWGEPRTYGVTLSLNW